MKHLASPIITLGLLLSWIVPPDTAAAPPPNAALGRRFVAKCGVGTPIADRVVVYLHNDGAGDLFYRVRWLNRGGLTVTLTPVGTLSPGHIVSEELGPLGFSPGNELVVAQVTHSSDNAFIDAEVVGDEARRQLTCAASNAEADSLTTRIE